MLTTYAYVIAVANDSNNKMYVKTYISDKKIESGIDSIEDFELVTSVIDATGYQSIEDLEYELLQIETEIDSAEITAELITSTFKSVEVKT